MRHHKDKTIRFTLDFSIKEHTYLKMLAAQKGVSMKKVLLEGLYETAPNQKIQYLSDEKFKKSLAEIIDENDDILRGLADR